MARPSINNDVLTALGLMLCALALYIVPLRHASFYFDDRDAIVNNEAIKKIDLAGIFKAFNTRVLVGLSFALNYKCCGLSPGGYRFINVLIHGLNAFLVYLLAQATWGLYRRPPAIWPPLFAAALFLVHPIQTEAVNSITQRFVLMGSFFYLLTLLLYIRGHLIASLTAALAAMLCKEFTVTLPLMLALYDFYFLNSGTGWQRARRLAPFFAVTLIVPLLLLKTPSAALGVADIAKSDAFHHIDITRAKDSMARQDYFLTELHVMCTYVRLLWVPIHQNFDYDYPVSRTIDGKTLLCALFLLGLLAMAGIMYRHRRIISFGILWFFIALSVESSFIPIGHVIAEYRLYLAGVGFVFLVMELIYARPADRRILHGIAVFIIMLFSILTWGRNEIWRSEFTLWDDTVHKSPRQAIAYLNRGLAYFGQGQYAPAISDFKETIALKPDSAAAYNDLSVLYALKGNLPQALVYSDAAIAVDPGYAQAYHNHTLIKNGLKK